MHYVRALALAIGICLIPLGATLEHLDQQRSWAWHMLVALGIGCLALLYRDFLRSKRFPSIFRQCDDPAVYRRYASVSYVFVAFACVLLLSGLYKLFGKLT